MKTQKLNMRLSGSYFVIFGALACYYPFLAFYFEGKGLNYGQTGMLFGLNSLVIVICQPIWGYLTDKYWNKRGVIMVTMLLSALSILFFVFVESFYTIAFSITLFMVFQSATCPIADAYAYEIMEEHREIQYGRIRLMGSLSYAILALCLGSIVKKFGINSTFYIYATMTFAGVFILKGISFQGKSKASKINFKDIVGILKNNQFRIFITSVTVVSIALGANGSYLAVLIRKTGGDASAIGFLWFVIAISELPVFFIGNKLLKKYGVLNLYFISLIVFSIRLFLGSICSTYTMVIVVQSLQGITFTFYIVASLQYVNEIVPPQARTSAITIYSAIGSGLGGFIGNLAGGFLLEICSVFSLFKILGVVPLVALVIALPLKGYHSCIQITKGIAK